MTDKIAILMDGGFVKKVLKRQLGRFPAPADIVQIHKDILANNEVRNRSGGQGSLFLFRSYFYDAPPFTGIVKNPLTGATENLGGTPFAKDNQKLLDQLELEPDFAVRRGEIVARGWKLGSAFLRSLARVQQQSVTVTPSALIPNLQQKGVDLRIGLDLTLLAVKHTVDIIGLVTGDADLIPAMKLARKEGVRVYLHTLGNPVNRQLKVHADLVVG